MPEKTHVDLAKEKLSKLQKAHVYETDPAVKFKLEQEIKELKALISGKSSQSESESPRKGELAPRHWVTKWLEVVILAIVAGVAVELIHDYLKKPPQQTNVESHDAGRAQSAPKASDSSHPKLAFDVFGLQHGASKWQPLGLEIPLRSGDDYFVRAQTFTRGYLYIFQVDSSGKFYWLFPSNTTYSNSFGDNPLEPLAEVTLPPDSSKVYALDDTLGEEQIYALYSANRWVALEEKLKIDSERTNVATKFEALSLLAENHTIEAQVKGPARVEAAPVAKEDRLSYPVDLPPFSAVADGDRLLQVRRFQHLARAATHVQ